MPLASILCSVLCSLGLQSPQQTTTTMDKDKTKGKQNGKGPPTVVVEPDVTYKVLILGDAKVGKTSILRTLCGEKFRESYINTVGLDFTNKLFQVDGAKVQLQIWDTAGQERFKTFTKRCYRGTQGIVLVYDITSERSFDAVEPWLKLIEEELDMDSVEPIPVFLIGNKSDLEERRQVDTEKARRIAERYFAYNFLEANSKDKETVSWIFKHMSQSLLEIYNQKLMTAYMTPHEKMERYNSVVLAPVCNGHCACRGMPETQAWKQKKRRRLKLRRRKSPFLCCFHRTSE